MLKILFLAIIGYIAYRLFLNDYRKRTENSKLKSRNMAKKTEDLVKDPICGMYVPKENTISVRKGQKFYYFCSYDCRDAFLKQNTH